LLLPKPDVFGDGSAKSSSANHDHIEWPAAASFPGVSFGNIIAKIPALNVFRKRCPLRTLRHLHLPLEETACFIQKCQTIARVHQQGEQGVETNFKAAFHASSFCT